MNLPTYVHALVDVCYEEAENIRASDWRPRPVGLDLQLALLIVYKQSQRTVQLWNVFECNFWMFPKLSGMDINCSEGPHLLGRGLEYDQPQYIEYGANAHRFIVESQVGNVVRFAKASRCRRDRERIRLQRGRRAAKSGRRFRHNSSAGLAEVPVHWLWSWQEYGGVY